MHGKVKTSNRIIPRGLMNRLKIKEHSTLCNVWQELTDNGMHALLCLFKQRWEQRLRLSRFFFKDNIQVNNPFSNFFSYLTMNHKFQKITRGFYGVYLYGVFVKNKQYSLIVHKLSGTLSVRYQCKVFIRYIFSVNHVFMI